MSAQLVVLLVRVDGVGIEPTLLPCKRSGQPLTIPSMFSDCENTSHCGDLSKDY